MHMTRFAKGKAKLYLSFSYSMKKSFLEYPKKKVLVFESLVSWIEISALIFIGCVTGESLKNILSLNFLIWKIERKKTNTYLIIL